MIQGRSGTCLLFKTAQSLGVFGEMSRQQLKRNLSAEREVLRQIHVAHPARAEPFYDSVMTDCLSFDCVRRSHILFACQRLSFDFQRWIFNEASGALVSRKQRLNFSAQRDVPYARFIEKLSALLPIKLQRGVK